MNKKLYTLTYYIRVGNMFVDSASVRKRPNKGEVGSVTLTTDINKADVCDILEVFSNDDSEKIRIVRLETERSMREKARKIQSVTGISDVDVVCVKTTTIEDVVELLED